MSLIQITRKPVTVYRSTDDQAPQFTANPGSLKTILEACLVSGYGSKQGLGWEMPFSDANSAVFRSQEVDATKCCLQIKNTAARYVEMAGYKTMSSLDSGNGLFAATNNKRLALLRSGVTNAPWTLVGHGKAFWLFVHHAYNDGNRPNSSNWIFFGDFPSYAAADKGNCLIAHDSFTSNYDYLYDSTLAPSRIWDDHHRLRMALSYDQLSANRGVRTNSRCLRSQGIAYPDVITGGLQADSIDLYEWVSSDNPIVLRGILPGLYACSHDLRSINEGVEMAGFDGSDDTFAKLRLLSDSNSSNDRYGYYLVNLTAWQA